MSDLAEDSELIQDISRPLGEKDVLNAQPYADHELVKRHAGRFTEEQPGVFIPNHASVQDHSMTVTTTKASDNFVLNCLGQFNNNRSPPAEDLIPIMACCCDISSFNPVMFQKCGNPGCYGFFAEYTLCCAEQSVRFLELSPDHPRVFMRILSGEDNLICPPKTVFKQRSTGFCLNYRCALPCEEEVPCMCNFFGLTMFYNFQLAFYCCETLAKIKQMQNMSPPSNPVFQRFANPTTTEKHFVAEF